VRVGDAIDNEAAKNVQRLGFSFAVLQRNHAELTLAIRYLTSNKVAYEMIGVDDRWHRQEGMREVVSLLHNYVASAKSLVDHSRRIHRKAYQPKGLREECDRQIQSRFVTDPLIQFVQDLREMAQHYRLPTVRMTTSFQKREGGTDMAVRLQLMKADVQEWKRWGPHSKKFLDAAAAEIDLLETVEGYHSRVTAFYTWFRAEQDKAHGIWPALRERLTTHGIESPETEIVQEVRRRVAGLKERNAKSLTFADLHSALLPALTIWDSRRLVLCEYDTASWLHHALTAIAQRFDLPEEVEKDLTSLIAP
jgi:hypothetical protein